MTESLAGERPLPEATELTAPFWQALRERRLVVQRCNECHQYRFPPEPGCFGCGSLTATWTPVSGRATLYSWTVTHPPLLPYFRARSPWPVVAVELEEGPRMISNLVGIPMEEYAIGMALQADFEDVDGDVTLLIVRPRSDGD